MNERTDIVDAGFPPVRYLMNTEMDTVPLTSSSLVLGLLGSLIGVALCVWSYRALSRLAPREPTSKEARPAWELLALFAVALGVRLFHLFEDPLTEFEMTTVLMVDRAEFFPGLHEHIDAASRGHFPFLLWVTWLTQGLSGVLLAGRIPAALSGALAATVIARCLGRDMENRNRAILYLGVCVIPMGVFVSRWTAGYPWVLLGEALMLQGVFELRRERELAGWSSLLGGLLLCASFQANGVFSGAIIACVWAARISRKGLARKAALTIIPAGIGVALFGSPWFIAIASHAKSMKLVGDFLPYLSLSPFGIASDIHMLLHWTLDLAFAGALPLAGAVPVAAGLVAAGLLRAARIDREITAMVVGLLLTFVIVFVNMALGPYLFEGIDGIYFHIRQHCALVVLGGIALWGWLRFPRSLTSLVGAALAILFVAGWLNLEQKEKQPDYANAFGSISQEFQPGDSILVLPSYTNWSVLRHYGLEAANKRDNKALKNLLNFGYEQPRFMVPIRVPLADQLRSTLVNRLWVLVVDDRVWGVYPHYNFEYTKRGVADVDNLFDPEAAWTHEGFMAWRLMRKKKINDPWPDNQKLIEVGVNDLYYLEGVQPPPLRKASKRYLSRQNTLEVTLPENTCSVRVELGLVPPADGAAVSMNPTRDEASWTDGASQEFPVQPNLQRFKLKLRAADGPRKVWFQQIKLHAVACPKTEGSEGL